MITVYTWLKKRDLNVPSRHLCFDRLKMTDQEPSDFNTDF